MAVRLPSQEFLLLTRKPFLIFWVKFSEAIADGVGRKQGRSMPFNQSRNFSGELDIRRGGARTGVGVESPGSLAGTQAQQG